MTNELNDLQSILDQLKEWDVLYHEDGKPVVSDREYDRLKTYAFNMDPANVYFKKIGSAVRGGKVKLPYIMGSLDQIPENSVDKWIADKQLEEEIIVASDKLDGVSVMLVYNNGAFSIAYGRGDGVYGSDMTRNIKHLNGVKLELPGINYLVVRGEAIMRKDIFEKKYSGEFANARNMVAGCLNRKETDVSILNDIDFVAYSVVDSDQWKNCSHGFYMDVLDNIGFVTAHREIITNNNEQELKKLLIRRLQESPYALDGLVFTLDKMNDANITKDSDSLNPTHSYKYKILDEDSIVEAVVRDVHWEISKNGFLKPRVEITPVNLYGTVVTFATGFNAKFINDSGIGRGAVVRLTKSGSVIPYILETLTKVTPSLPDISKYDWSWNDNNVEAVVGLDHPEALFKQVLDFFETINVDLLKEASLRKIMDYLNCGSYEDYITTIIDLSDFEWNNIIGVNGGKIHTSLHKKLSALPMETYLGAVNYMGFGFGVRKAKKLIESLSDKNTVFDLTVEQIVDIDGFDTKTATQTFSGLHKAQKFLNELIKSGYVTIVDSSEGQTKEMVGLNVVFTGFRDSGLEATITKMGGKVGSGVSKKTTHVLTNEPNSTSGKAQKARELGVTIMTPEVFKDTYGI